MTLEELMLIPYEANGRSKQGADCYGLVRMARVHLYNKPWLESYAGVEGSDKKALTDALHKEVKNLRLSSAVPGAIATAWRGNLCTHIAVVVDVDGRKMILETDEPGVTNIGPRLTDIRYFEQRFLKVVYYDD